MQKVPLMPAKLKSLPQIEQDILAFWQERDIFAKTVALRKDAEPFVFYDGPPFATGLPHYGHILQMAIKDAVLRYKTMQGYRVPRKIGWDTHGLPVEYELEKELKLSGKKDIEAYGIDRFVEAARGIVLRYTSEWKTTMERMGRWVDVSHPYTTMDNNYIESVWWAFSELYKKGLVYQDFRVSPYCPRCGTVLSNFEVNQGYEDNVPDVSVYVSVPVVTPGVWAGKRLVLWTTTPWTLPANVALAVKEDASYAVVSQGEEAFIVASDRASAVFPEGKIESTVVGKELVGLQYEPLYRTTAVTEGMYRVVEGHHVTTDNGTGIVHIAPAYGEDDFTIGRQADLPLLQTVEKDGTIKKGASLPGEGRFVKDADADIIRDLSERGLLVREEKIRHTYPFCWRCSTPLLYFPTTSWFVKVTDLKDRLVAENKKIAWLPDHLRDGRFGKWLEGARDWAVSRDRYWGAPLPVWECSGCQSQEVFGSRQALEQYGASTTDLDLHRPYIDELTFPCQKCQAPMQRVPFVFDCWFESGSMPFAQHHYPFENQDVFDPTTKHGYPADFIAEALDQTRGWFYTLHVLGVGLFDHRAYNSVVVSGLLLAADGKKLSKRLRNYTAPEVVFDELGVDALRLFLFTATSLGEDYRFSDAAVKDVHRRWIVPLLNVLQYYHLSLPEREETSEPEDHHAELDAWIKARVYEATEQVNQAMQGSKSQSPYDLVRACRTFGPLVEDLSTWYVRLSRGRRDRHFTETLREVLLALSRLYAPFLPFLMEHIYQEVTLSGPESVHMCEALLPSDWEKKELLVEMTYVRNLVSFGRDMRVKQGIPLRQPLQRLEIVHTSDASLRPALRSLIAQELQLETVEEVAELSESLATESREGYTLGLAITITPELAQRGVANGLRRTIQDLRKQAGLQASDSAHVVLTGLKDTGVIPLLQSQLGQTQITTTAEGDVLATGSYETEDQPITVQLYSAT